MAFKVTIVEEFGGTTGGTARIGESVTRYEQTVEVLDLQAVIHAVNTPPPPPKRSHRRRAAAPTGEARP